MKLRWVLLAAGIAAAVPGTGDAALRAGAHGAQVRTLELELAWHGFPSGQLDGRFGPQLVSALRHFQRSVGLAPDGVAGPRTLAALQTSPRRSPTLLAWPLFGRIGDRFGRRGNRFHSGIDVPAPLGTPVLSAAAGFVTWAGQRPGGWGLLVVLRHAGGVRTMYAHLSEVDVHVGDVVAGGAVVGRVGATGDATGPHLHFEVRVDGAAVDPLGALVPLPHRTRSRSG